jgi:hypothetical protein
MGGVNAPAGRPKKLPDIIGTMEDLLTQAEIDTLTKQEIEQIEELAKKCPRCGGASANKGNPAGRCRKHLSKLAADKKKPGSWQRAQTKADDALRRQKGKNGTAHKKTSGLGSRASIVKQTQSAEKKTGQKLSPDRKNNGQGYAASNTRMVPEHLNRGRHHVDAKKLKAWRSKLKKCELDYSELYTCLLSKAAQSADTALLSLLEDMHYNDLANFINNNDDNSDVPLKKTELLLKDAENSAAYNMKLAARTKLAHQKHIVKDAKNLPYKAYKTMPNEQGSPELHVMVHRGVGGSDDFNPNAKGKNMLNVNNTHVQTKTDSVHSLYPSAAHEFIISGNPDYQARKDAKVAAALKAIKENEKHPANVEYQKLLDTARKNAVKAGREPWEYSPEDSQRHREHMQTPQFKEYTKQDEQLMDERDKAVNAWEESRHKAGKNGVLSFWVPISKFNGHGGYKTDDMQAQDQAHVNVAPGKFQRVKHSEMKDLQSKSKPPKEDSMHQREQLLTPDRRYLHPKE